MLYHFWPHFTFWGEINDITKLFWELVFSFINSLRNYFTICHLFGTHFGRYATYTIYFDNLRWNLTFQHLFKCLSKCYFYKYSCHMLSTSQICLKLLSYINIGLIRWYVNFLIPTKPASSVLGIWKDNF